LSDDLNLEGLSRDQLLQLDEFLRETVKAKNDRPLDFIVPYDKQRLFFDLGSKLSTKVASERLLVAANKVGKTYAGAIEMAAHLTGLYPEWWNGRRFTHAIDAWAACDTHTLARDGAQRYLFGPPNDPDGLGSGLIPRHLIVGTPIAGHGATGLFDTARVRHVSGKTSSIQFKAYSQGRANVQSANLHVVWLDEQPPDIDLYTEFLARLLHTRGILYMTFTPLRDIAFVRERFYKGRNEARDYVEMSYEEKPGVTSEEIEMMKEQYPQHTWAARIYGKAELGAGAAFETTEKNLMFPADMYIPDYWPKIWGIDFGITHPFAAVLCAWDRDTDTFYVLDAFKLADTQPIDHVDRMDRIAPTSRSRGRTTATPARRAPASSSSCPTGSAASRRSPPMRRGRMAAWGWRAASRRSGRAPAPASSRSRKPSPPGSTNTAPTTPTRRASTSGSTTTCSRPPATR
jgi:phage terminase large subunit-like protein